MLELYLNIVIIVFLFTFIFVELLNWVKDNTKKTWHIDKSILCDSSGKQKESFIRIKCLCLYVYSHFSTFGIFLVSEYAYPSGPEILRTIACFLTSWVRQSKELFSYSQLVMECESGINFRHPLITPHPLISWPNPSPSLTHPSQTKVDSRFIFHS